MPKEARKKKTSTAHNPLGDVIEEDENRAKFARDRKKNRDNKKGNNDSDDEDDLKEPLMDERTSRKILELSRQQQLEEDAEEMKKRLQQQRQEKSRSSKSNNNDADDSSIEDDSDEEKDDGNNFFMNESDQIETEIDRDSGYVSVHGLALSSEEEAVVSNMMGGKVAQERRTLADIILEKIAEKEEKDAQQSGDMMEDGEEEYMSDLPPKVVQVYTEIGKILSRYTSGKLPKAFKVIPALSNWEEVLYLTRPDLWTPQAMYAATRLFASNLNPKMAQRFFNLVLLDSVRADIVANKKLNYHYYISLKKAVYKPAAFFKGILLPLCVENCTLREAAIVSSVLQRVSIPVQHSAVAIHKLAQMEEYSGAASVFITTLLNKKYSLPAPVIKGLVTHFYKFSKNEKIVLPVLWHQSFLVFVQRYKNELKDEARDMLKQVMKVHFHPKITPEIRRELFGAQAFKDERNKKNNSGLSSSGGDVVMMES
eukprot:CAMPEP_0178960122 /NCGR_PEP_ID=MMETSP0789-20121207/12758_1 /TAXON_ID=3005 /ORGANISM="Rhizosolenia setigera, Strain CCMP 1694" /LENGTH=481 /DNA_ID=CAMNT_0020643375 /DNA_START=79 /DNA_END=1524 /DNA_ORIENTATION=-